MILERFGVVLTKTQRELQRMQRMGLVDVEADRQQIKASRWFGTHVGSG